MITTMLVIIGLILLIFAFEAYLIGNKMTLDQLKALTQAVEEFTKNNRIVAYATKKSVISFQSDFVKATKVRSVYLSMRNKAFAVVWENGRSSHFLADSKEDLAQLIVFAMLLQSGMMCKELTGEDENIKQADDEPS